MFIDCGSSVAKNFPHHLLPCCHVAPVQRDALNSLVLSWLYFITVLILSSQCRMDGRATYSNINNRQNKGSKNCLKYNQDKIGSKSTKIKRYELNSFRKCSLDSRHKQTKKHKVNNVDICSHNTKEKVHLVHWFIVFYSIFTILVFLYLCQYLMSIFILFYFICLFYLNSYFYFFIVKILFLYLFILSVFYCLACFIWFYSISFYFIFSLLLFLHEFVSKEEYNPVLYK